MTPASLPELLCPAGDEAALRAAVDCGADAVYLGYKAFGARASAVNFDGEALSRAVRYAHLYHARVHVTVNTLIKQSELEDVRQALGEIAQAGADAVIVQDLGVAALVRDEFPALALHASTQAALRNAADARFAKAFGFSRAVLARECALDDVKAVVATGIETEVFAHGALCSSVSGRCLLSSMAGGRSGNRGRCAQPCRMPTSLGSFAGALLSLRDLCTLPRLPELCDAGVTSLKVEGRLKSAEYVAVVTEVYRRALDEIAAGSFDPEDPRSVDKLKQVFNRGGFTQGHIFGAEDAALCAWRRVSHEGVPLGRVIAVRGQLATVQTQRDLGDGDSLQLRDEQDTDLRYSGHDVPAGGQAILRLRPGLQVQAGCAVARLQDAKQLEAARRHAPKPIPIAMEATFALNRPMQLRLTDGESAVTVEGDPAQRAQSRAATQADVRRQLGKLGDTPFLLEKSENCTVELEDGLFLPVSALNALRRAGVEALTKARAERFRLSGRECDGQRREAHSDGQQRQAQSPVPECGGQRCEAHSDRQQRQAQLPQCAAACPPNAPTIGVQTLAVLFSDPSLADELTRQGANFLLYEPCDLRPAALSEALDRLPDGAWISLPPQTSQATLDSIRQIILRRAAHLGGVRVNSVGQLTLDWGGLPQMAGEGIPIANRYALKALCQTPALAFTLWPEWTAAEQRALEPFPLPPLLTVYGREPLMLLNHCPERVARGLAQGRATCRICEHGLADASVALCQDDGDSTAGRRRLVSPAGARDAAGVRDAAGMRDAAGARDAAGVRDATEARDAAGALNAAEAGPLRRALDTACGRQNPSLTDSRGYRFPLRRTIFPEGCVLRLLNALPTDLRAFDGERRALGAGMLLRFTTESREEQLLLTSLFAALNRGETEPPAENATAGHWRRGVE